MAIRFGTGPVFVYESITAARRWQSFALRSLFVLALLVVLAVVWQSSDLAQGPYAGVNALRQLAQLGERIYYGVAGVQLALVLLAAPAATAGAVCLDRARGGLEHMFATDLSNSEIVLGKLAARLLPVAALVASGLPVLALSTLLGGIIPEALITLTLVTAAVALFGCSLAITLSVRATKTNEVLMAVYAVVAVWLLAYPFWSMAAVAKRLPPAPAWFTKLNPFVLTYAPYAYPGYIDSFDVAVFVVVASVLSAVLLVVAVVRLRRDLAPRRRRSERWDALMTAAKANLFSWWPSPQLDSNPVLWREWHRNRPSRMARMVELAYLTAVVAGMAIGIRQAVLEGVTMMGPNMLVLTNFLGVAFGLLILSVTAPTALSEERVRGSLDVLMSTPLPTSSIVLGKWWGTFRRWLPIVLLPALTGLFVGFATPDTPPWFAWRIQPPPVPPSLYDRFAAFLLPMGFALADAAACTSVGLALATWFKRPARAVGVSVASYLFMAIGWMVLIEAAVFPLLRRYNRNLASSTDGSYLNALNQVLICPSPMASQVTPYETLHFHVSNYRPMMWRWQAAELILVLLFAAGMLGLTLSTFNRCLGRVAQQPGGSSESHSRSDPEPARPEADLAGSVA
jgi:ABC-type transport system involved in multi-copper enzyme maturation permease subunit